MSWNACQILASIKNGTNLSFSGQFFRWTTANGTKVVLKESCEQWGHWCDVRGPGVAFNDFVQLKEGDIATVKRIFLKKALS